jgi:hypothetical protein
LQFEIYKKEYESYISDTVGDVKRFSKKHGLEQLVISVELKIYTKLGENHQIVFPETVTDVISLFTLEYKII